MRGLRTRGFVVCRAETNEGFFSPCSVSHDLRSNRPSLPVELDYLSAHCRPTPFPRHLRRVAVRLPDFSRRVGDARDQRHHPTTPLDHVLQDAGMRQPEDVASGASLVRGGRAGAADGHSQSGDRRHADFAPIRNSAGQHPSARPCKKGQSNPICIGAMLGDPGYQCARQCGAEICAAHRVAPSACQRQSQQVDHCIVLGARLGSSDEGQARPGTVRCLVHAGTTGIAAALPKGACNWSGAARHSFIPAACRIGQAGSRTPQEIWDENDSRGDPGFAGNRSQTDLVWQGAVDSLALGEGNGALSQRRAGMRGVERILRCGQAVLVEGAALAGDRNGVECRAEEILRLYARRWGIEPLFHNLKRWWGVNNLWQQKRAVLELWMRIRSTAWTLVQLLSLVVEEIFPIAAVSPWRDKQPLTAGLVAQWLRMEFTGLAFLDGFNRKPSIFTFPEQRGDPRLQV